MPNVSHNASLSMQHSEKSICVFVRRERGATQSNFGCSITIAWSGRGERWLMAEVPDGVVLLMIGLEPSPTCSLVARTHLSGTCGQNNQRITTKRVTRKWQDNGLFSKHLIESSLYSQAGESFSGNLFYPVMSAIGHSISERLQKCVALCILLHVGLKQVFFFLQLEN